MPQIQQEYIETRGMKKKTLVIDWFIKFVSLVSLTGLSAQWSSGKSKNLYNLLILILYENIH